MLSNRNRILKVRNKLTSPPTVPTVALCIGIDLSSYPPNPPTFYFSCTKDSFEQLETVMRLESEKLVTELPLQRKTQYGNFLCEQKDFESI